MIYGYVGRLGHGKSMRMVVDGLALHDLRAKRRETWIAANILVRPRNADVNVIQLPMDGFSEALADTMSEARAKGAGLVVMVDEIDEVYGATDWQNMSRGDRHRIKQSRKYRCDLLYTAQFIDQVEKSIRNVTETVELVRAFPSPSLMRTEAGKRPWLIRGQLFRPGAVRELTAEPDKDKRIGSVWHRYHKADEALYDSDEIIIPPRPEALCAKHSREVKEARCPLCHPKPHEDPRILLELAEAADEANAA